ncbi:WD40 repeat domain-containing protein, partial [Geitlerinema sp. P-1104]|uniref:WD40 repeat domain-containing protein n=1 Tax=Geitlerinema sp. P-1104 TaxID=2546230 RepID=UPI0014775CA2
ERRRWPGNAQAVLALSPDGQTLVTAGAGDISLWNVETGQRQATLPQDPPDNLVVALSPQSRLLAMTVPADNGVIQIWDTTTGALLHSETASHISTLAFGINGKTLIGGDIYGGIGIWHLHWSEDLSRPAKPESPET